MCALPEYRPLGSSNTSQNDSCKSSGENAFNQRARGGGGGHCKYKRVQGGQQSEGRIHFPTQPGRHQAAISNIALIAMAISQSPNKMLTVKEICNCIIQKFPYYSKRWPAWRQSIRQNLSLNDCFIKVPSEYGSSRKGNFWKLHPSSGEMFGESFLRRRYRFLRQLPQKLYAEGVNSSPRATSPTRLPRSQPNHQATTRGQATFPTH